MLDQYDKASLAGCICVMVFGEALALAPIGDFKLMSLLVVGAGGAGFGYSIPWQWAHYFYNVLVLRWGFLR
jgi:hypothetical protein